MSWSLHPPAWQCKRLASGGIELIKSLPLLMCFKRIYAIVWHQTNRFPGRSFPFVSPPRMFELITAKLHTLGLLLFDRKQTETHTNKQQPVKVAFLDQNSSIRGDYVTEIQDCDSAIWKQFHLHESKLHRRVKSFFSRLRFVCLFSLISCFLCHREARRLMGPSYATACSSGLFFPPFPINPCQFSTWGD